MLSPEALLSLSKCPGGSRILIADANYPSDNIASECVVKTPIRINGTTCEILEALIKVIPLDRRNEERLGVMDRTDEDKARNLEVPAYQMLFSVAGLVKEIEMEKIERFKFYEDSKKSYLVIQSTDTALYANCMIRKGCMDKDGNPC